MKTINFVLVFIIMIIGFYSCSQSIDPTKNEYLGAEKPGLTPVLFGENLATNNDNRHGALTFSPDGNEIYYSVYQNKSHPQKFFFTELKNGIWSAPYNSKLIGSI